MTLAPPPTDLRRALLERLIDHAALFPPASMAVPEALREDRRVRAGDEGWIVGRFLCPASRLGELSAHLAWDEAPALAVVCDAAGGAPGDRWVHAFEDDLRRVAISASEGAPVELLEARLPAPALAADAMARLRAALGGREVAVHFELVPGVALVEALAAFGAAGAGAKLRCGGPAPEEVPSVEAVARFVAACRDAGVAFKATAGLHAAVRHVPADGQVPAHGFVNLLAAAILAHAHGLDAAALAAVLAEEDPAAFVVEADRLAVGDHAVDAAQVARGRELFRAFGSCSVAEPVADLRALGLLAP